MHSIHPLSGPAHLFWRRKPALIIAIVGVLAFILWTLPNWKEFWSNVLQFPGLWQIPTNRRIILYLTMKIASPLLLMGITGIILWLSSLMQSSAIEAGTNDMQYEQQQNGPPTEKVIRSTSSLIYKEPTLETQATSFSTPPRSQPIPVSRGYNPETPLPPTLLLTEAPGKQSEEANSSVKNEQTGVPTEQRRDTPPTKATLTDAPLQIVNLSQPLLSSAASSQPVISLQLLKDVRMTLNVPGEKQIVVPLTLNAKRVQLLAYIAWRRGELIDRDKILEHVFGWGLADEDATEDKLSERFESHKKLLRKKNQGSRDGTRERTSRQADN